MLDKENAPEAHAKAEAARPEYVVAVKGTVRRRAAGLENPNMATGEIEIVAQELLLLNDAKTPPFSPAEDAIANEEVRLKYRYLDLRRPQMQRNFELRHNGGSGDSWIPVGPWISGDRDAVHDAVDAGGERGDYLVPSRVHGGQFYALPQSPQIFKQILMISGFDKYFQIARCFRDEDLRADRQPEFTQIDLEMTFPSQEAVFRTVEGFLTAAFKTAGIALNAPFIQMTYDQAIAKYGIDKPDMRLPAMVDLTAELTPELRETLKIAPELPVLGFVIPSVGALSGTQRRALAEEIRSSFGDSGLDFLDVARLRTNEAFHPLAEAIGAKLTAEQIVFGAGPFTTDDLAIVITPKPGTPASWNYDPQWIWKRVGALRLQLGQKFAEKHGRYTKTGTAADFKFLWVTDFPMYEWDEESKVWNAAHHPFTSPHEDDILAGRLTNDKGAVRALAYDIVLNGTELGSGSIRIHRKDVQAEIFRSLGMSDEEAKERFGFFLDALEYGTPPHGGIALGLDRIVMIPGGGDEPA